MSQSKFGEWSDALYKGILAARLGREVLLKYKGKLEHVEKKFQAGLVSEADKESEKVIFDFLRKNFPHDDFVGEESTLDMTKVQGPAVGKNRWIVDPLDGTTNYIHQFPIYAVSIGYEVNGKIQLGIIDVPALGEVYTAVRGCGAYVNGQRLQVSGTQKLEDSYLATGFVSEIEENLQEQLQIFSKVVRQCRGVRRAGAAAYDLCMVAKGVFDGYWEKNLKPWDSAAGLLLVEEAGGVVKTYKGQEYSPYKNSIVAGNNQICEQLIQRIKPMALTETN